MTTPFDLYIPVVIVVDASSPDGYTDLNGDTYMIPPDTVLPTDGSGLFLGKLPGYARQVDGAWEWVIAQPDDALMKAINRLPGAAGWANADARNTWRRVFRRLRAAGIPGPILEQVAGELYSAAAINQQAPPPA